MGSLGSNFPAIMRFNAFCILYEGVDWKKVRSTGKEVGGGFVASLATN